MSLGVKIKVLREERGMNQKELAEASSITQATISRIEKGQVKQLKSDALARLAGALQVTTDYLVGKTKRLTLEEPVSGSPPPGFDRPGRPLQSSISDISKDLRRLPLEAQEEARNFVRFLLEREESKRAVLGEKITRLEEPPKQEKGAVGRSST